MTLTLIMGRAGSGKTETCLTAIKNRLYQNPDGKPLILLVPEQATFQLERELAADPQLNGFARAYVLGFRRLANRVLLETGGALRPQISELGKKLVLGKLLQEHQRELTVFHKAAQERTFAETLTEIVEEFKNYGVTPEQLLAVEESLDSSHLKDKLRDLQLIYAEFEAFLYGRYTDPEDYLRLLADKIPEASLLRDAEVWVDGFSWFTPCERAVLRQILLAAGEVSVTLCLVDPSAPQHAAETSLFHRQWTTYRQLKELARELDVRIREVELKEQYRFIDRPLLKHMEEDFFTLPTVPFTQAAMGLRLAEAANRRGEIDGIARDILRLCREENYRWRDIAVLVRDTAGYADAIETVFEQYDIPFFSDHRRRVMHHPLAELLRSALEVIDSRWDYEPVFRALKSDLFSLPREEVDKLENYVLEFGIRGSRWTNDEPWTFVRRFSLGEDEEENLDEKQAANLTQINEIRTCAMLPLRQLGESLTKELTVSAITKALYDFIVLLKVPETLETWADAAEQAGELALAREHRQVLGNIFDLFDQLVEALGEVETTLADYLEILNDGLNNLELSLIPPGLDYVIVAGLERARIPNVKAVYVPGVNEGVLPMRAHNEGLLNDEERNTILAAGVEIASGNLSTIFAEQFLIYTALTRASQYLWISYALADEEGKAMLPSLIIKRLKDFAPAVTLEALTVEPPETAAKQYVVHPRQSLSLLVSILNACKKGRPFGPVWRDVYNWAVGQPEYRARLAHMVAGLFYHNVPQKLGRGLSGRLYLTNNKLLGSVTRFESFEACPFKHFARYGLKLKERAIFRLSAPDYGQFLHAALKEFAQRVLAEGKSWGDVEPAQRETVCDEIVAALTPKLQNEILMSSAQYRHLAGRLGRTVKRAVGWLAEFDKVSSFKPVVLEKPFGRGKNCWPALTFTLKDGTQLEIAGQIDRVDAAEQDGIKYLVIIDYKSGGAWLKLPDVYYGLKLQLLTYLLAVYRYWGEEKACPAGILYFFLKNPSVLEKAPLAAEAVEKKIRDQLKMPGWVLNDLLVAQLLDHNLNATSDFLKLGLKKDQTFKKSSEAYLKSKEEFDLLLAHVQEVLEKVADGVLAGENGISPYRLGGREACSQCDYRAVCQFDLLLPGNNFRKLRDMDDASVLKQLAEGRKEEER